MRVGTKPHILMSTTTRPKKSYSATIGGGTPGEVMAALLRQAVGRAGLGVGRLGGIGVVAFGRKLP